MVDLSIAMLVYQRVFFLVKEPIDPIGLILLDLLDPVPGESDFFFENL